MKVRPTIEVGISKNMMGPPSFRNCHINSFCALSPGRASPLKGSASDGAVWLVFVVERELEQSVVSSEFVLHSVGPTREGRGLFDRPLTKERLHLAHVSFQDPHVGDVSVRMQSELHNHLSREGRADGLIQNVVPTLLNCRDE